MRLAAVVAEGAEGHVGRVVGAAVNRQMSVPESGEYLRHLCNVF